MELGMGAGLLSFLEKNRRNRRFSQRDLARLEATHPPVAFRIEQIEIALEEKEMM
ncbi:hypothetical protein [Bacillus cereus]|uniref:hypothetical protein n=1 Tax=Bacillus cereus TaxID=1396 RepID=UPI001CD5F691|nr:hypothetical protein [Bacillus cereus]